MNKNRNYGLDLLRILSAFAVIVLHVNAQFMSHESFSENILWQTINLVTRFSVPCFVMISGAFLLNNPKNVDWKYFYKKQFSKIGIPFLVIVLIYGIISFYKNVFLIRSYSDFFKDILACRFGNLWFMPMIIGLYMLTPWLSRCKEKTSKSEFSGITIFLFLWAILSQVTSKYVLPYSMGVVFAYLPYYFLGSLLIGFHVQNKILYKYWGGYCVY